MKLSNVIPAEEPPYPQHLARHPLRQVVKFQTIKKKKHIFHERTEPPKSVSLGYSDKHIISDVQNGFFHICFHYKVAYIHGKKFFSQS